jgi:hypothetical protein
MTERAAETGTDEGVSEEQLMRHTMNDQPQRLPNGQWRCERGSGYGGAEWCSRPAAWVIEGLSPASRGAILCAEHYTDRVPSSVRYVPLDNPAPPSAPSPRDERSALADASMPADARRALKTLLDRPAEPYYCLTGGVFAVARRCESMVFVTWASTFSERMYANEDDARAALSPALGTAPLIVDGVPVSREEAAAATQVYEQGDDGIEPAERRYRKALASLGTEGR